MPERECGSCTKCCEGWLMGQINLRTMYPGKPCYLVEIGIGCKDYENRPTHPCKIFSCAWLTNSEIPNKYKPEACGVIITIGFHKKSKVINLIPAPNDPSEDMINWFKNYADTNKYGLIYYRQEDPIIYGNVSMP